MFVLTKKQRLHGLECSLPTGLSFVLTFREATEDELEQFDHDLSVARNVPDDTPKQRGERINQVYANFASVLLVGWDRVVDEDKNPVPLTDEAKAVFIADPETRKFWRPYIVSYLYPDTKSAEGKQSPDPQS